MKHTSIWNEYTDVPFSSSPTRWVEESFTFEEPINRQIAQKGIPLHIGSHITRKKRHILYVLLFVGLFIILARSAQLQLIKGNQYSLFAERNRERAIPVPSERGLLYDIHMMQLTENIPKFSLALIPQDLPKKEEEKNTIVQQLAVLTKQDPNMIKNIIEEYGNYSYESITILDNLDYETALSIEIQSAELPGIHIQRGSKRQYITSGTASSSESLPHVIGYQSKLNKEELDRLYTFGYLPSDTIGKTGVEKQYETALRGTYGVKRIEVNALGKEQRIIAEEPPIPGDHLVLSIDYTMQQALEQIISSHLKKINKTKAVGIVVQPQTGAIMAMVSLPGYNNNDFSGGIDLKTYEVYTSNQDNPLFNRAIGGTYPSGSVIKPAIATAALTEGIITNKTSFLSNGGIRVGEWFFPDWQSGGHGITNVHRSIAWSVNTFYYYIGGGHNEFVGLGIEKISEYLKRYGISKKLGIDVPGEQPGFIPSKEWKEEVKKERWYIGDTYNISIGQGDLLVTPLQIAMMTAAIANGGTLYTPHVVDHIINPITKEKTIIPITPIQEHVTPSWAIEEARQGMKDCVTYGSCRRLGTLPFSTAGKTGTAQWNRNRDNHAWFTSFAPYNNPEIVVTILVEEGGGGSEVATPIAYDFYEWWGKNK